MLCLPTAMGHGLAACALPQREGRPWGSESCPSVEIGLPMQPQARGPAGVQPARHFPECRRLLPSCTCPEAVALAATGRATSSTALPAQRHPHTEGVASRLHGVDPEPWSAEWAQLKNQAPNGKNYKLKQLAFLQISTQRGATMRTPNAVAVQDFQGTSCAFRPFPAASQQAAAWQLEPHLAVASCAAPEAECSAAKDMQEDTKCEDVCSTRAGSGSTRASEGLRTASEPCVHQEKEEKEFCGGKAIAQRYAAALRRTVLGSYSSSQIMEMASAVCATTVPAGTVLFEENGLPLCLHLLVEGAVELSTAAGSSEHLSIGADQEGRLLEPVLLDVRAVPRHTHTVTVRVLSTWATVGVLMAERLCGICGHSTLEECLRAALLPTLVARSDQGPDATL